MAGITATYVSPSGFTVVTNRTDEFIADRRVKANCGVDGFKFGTITSSSYGAPNTTVNLTVASEDLTSNLTDVYYGLVSEGSSGSVPIHDHNGDEGSGGIVDISSKFYLHTQAATATSWTVEHNLGKLYPNVELISAGKSLAGTWDQPEITFDTTSQLTCTFTIGTSGYCKCVGG